VFVIVAEKGALAPAAAQAEPGAEAPEGSIIVTGVREAQEQAAAEKRDALNVTETLRANDVGKLPDQNVAEAIKRLPGLSVANDQGEGRYAIVRGIDPGLLNVTLNGQTLPAPEPDGRQVKLDDLPSAMIQAVTVTKSVLPNQDANAIAGEVAIRTRTAFDSKAPFTFDARGAIGRYSLNHKTAWKPMAPWAAALAPTSSSARWFRSTIPSATSRARTTRVRATGPMACPMATASATTT
jgi:TonB-dependent receptor